MKSLYLLMLGILFNTHTYAFPCFLTMVKDNCWINYNVKVKVVDTKNNQQLAEILVPKSQPWSRVSFQCAPGQAFLLKAEFSPVIWQSEAGRMYDSQRYWSLPKHVSAGEVAWNLSMCYAADFAGLPMPPSATNRCKCDFSAIPKLTQ